jgi:hypothetical protein
MAVADKKGLSTNQSSLIQLNEVRCKSEFFNVTFFSGRHIKMISCVFKLIQARKQKQKQ